MACLRSSAVSSENGYASQPVRWVSTFIINHKGFPRQLRSTKENRAYGTCHLGPATAPPPCPCLDSCLSGPAASLTGPCSSPPAPVTLPRTSARHRRPSSVKVNGNAFTPWYSPRRVNTRSFPLPLTTTFRPFWVTAFSKPVKCCEPAYENCTRHGDRPTASVVATVSWA